MKCLLISIAVGIPMVAVFFAVFIGVPAGLIYTLVRFLLRFTDEETFGKVFFVLCVVSVFTVFAAQVGAHALGCHLPPWFPQ